MIDLHTHSTFSDGLFTPEEIIEKAYKKGVRLLSLTDHDNVNGISDFLKYSKKFKDLNTIIGCEVSSNFNDVSDVHILALNIKDLKRLSIYSGKTNDIRRERIKSSVKKLKENGYNIDYERDINCTEFKCLTNRNLANILLNKKLVKTFEEAKGLILNGGIAYCNFYPLYPKVKDSIDNIISSGAIAVLAHPHRLKLNNEELEKYIKKLVDHGLNGIECYHSTSTLEQTEFFLKLAKKFNLIITGGSDHHGVPEETYKEFGMSNRLQRKIPESIAEQFIKKI